jgi:uncharacterized protein YqgQ
MEEEIKKIFENHLQQVSDLEGHGLDRNDVNMIKSEIISLYKEIERFFRRREND